MSLETASYDASAAARELDRFGVELPPEAARWLARLGELRDSRPEDEPPNGIAELIADGAKPADIDRAIARRLGQTLRAGQHRMAEQIAGQRVCDAILADRDRIHSELAATADDLIERLHRAAQLTETVVELTRAKRVEEAHLLATADSDAGELVDLYKLRDDFLTAPGSRWPTGWWDCGRVRNPWDCQDRNADDGSQFGRWRSIIRAGGELWFPTFEEATAASAAKEPGTTLPPVPPVRAQFVG